MLKYVETLVTFSEVPEEISLCINLSRCPCHCEGCHSPYLAGDIGKELNVESLKSLLEGNTGISCVAFMGGDNDPQRVNQLAEYVKSEFDLKVCWYSGRPSIAEGIKLENFDFIKVGPYRPDKGPLNDPNTNQRFYEINKISKLPLKFDVKDITYKFQKNVE